MLESDPKWYPEVNPKPLKWIWVDPSKHMVFVCGNHIGPLGEGSEIGFFSACFPGAYFYNCFVTVLDFVVKMVPKMTSISSRVAFQMAPFSDKDPKNSHSGVQEGSKGQK